MSFRRTLKKCLLLMILYQITSTFCEENSTNTDCKNSDCTTITPPVEAISRLLSSNSIQSNDTKIPAASSIDIVTTPETDTSLGLSAFSKYAQTSSAQSFNPSPFLGVISEVKGFPRGVAIGEVFPDSVGTVGDRHKYGYTSQNSYQPDSKIPHLNHHHHHIVDHEIRPTEESKPLSPLFRPTLESIFKTTSDFPFEFDKGEEKYKDYNQNSLNNYNQNSLNNYNQNLLNNYNQNAGNSYNPISSYPLGKPIKEYIPDDKPVTHEDRTKYSAFSPTTDHHLEKGGNKWRQVFKILATLIPFGLLVAALSPTLLVVNATDIPLPTRNTPLQQRSLQSSFFRTELNNCEMKRICEAISSADNSFKPYFEAIGQRTGGALQKITEMSQQGKCIDIKC